jgi:hypothetical protein
MQLLGRAAEAAFGHHHREIPETLEIHHSYL